MVDKIVDFAAELRVSGVQSANHDVAGHIDQKPAVQVSGNHRSRGPDPVSQPARDRPGSGAQFEAAPAALYHHSLT